MVRHSIIVLFAATVAGCASFDGHGTTNAQLAAFAASSDYPSTQSSDELRATALINRDDETIRILNPTDRAIRNGRVWVNGSFVTPVASIPPNGTVTLEREKFYSSRGLPLTDFATTATRVQLESDGTLYDLLGPVFE